MGSSELKAWTKLTKLVEELVRRPTDLHGSTPAYMDALEQIGAVETQLVGPAMPSAAYKKLVLETKVPKVLAELCIRALQQHPRSATLQAAASALNALLSLMGKQTGLSEAPASRLAASALQQLEQADLLQHMPALLADAAQQLEAASTGGQHAEPAAVAASTAAGSAREATHLVIYAGCMLSLFIKLFHLKPGVEFGAACAQPSLQLVPALFAAADGLQQQRAQLSNSPQLRQEESQALDAAHTVFFVLAEVFTNTALSGQHGPQLLPQTARCMAIMVCATLMAQPGSDAGAAVGSSSQRTASGRNSRRGSASNSGGSRPRSHAAAAAQGRGSGAAPASPASGFSFPVSPLTGRLFELLGVSRVTVMQAAGTPSSQATAHRRFLKVQQFADLYAKLIEGWVKDTPTPITSRELLVHLEVGHLLCLLLLQWVDSLPTGSSDRERAYEKVSSVSLRLCGDTMSGLLLKGGIVQMQLPAVPAAPQPMLLPLSSQQALPAAQQQQQYALVPPAPVVAELLPLITRLCKASLLLLLDEPSQHSSSPASSELDKVFTVLAAQTLGQLLSLLVSCSRRLVLLLAEAQDSDCGADAAPAGSTPGGLALLHAQDMFGRHAEDVIAVFEGLLRMWLRAELDEGSVEPDIQLDMEQRQQCTTAGLLASAAGPQSAAQRQCYSFLSSLQKYCMTQACFGIRLGDSNMFQAAQAAAAFLEEDLLLQQQQLQTSSPPMVSAAASLSLLPSLVIIGRCFLQLAAMLQPAVAPDGLAEQHQQHSMPDLIFAGGLVLELAATVRQWLRAHGQPLAAAGYGPQAVLQQLEQLLSSLEALTSLAAPSSMLRTMVDSIPQTLVAAVPQLLLAGAALSSLPVSCLCNYPGCTNAAGLSELGLVSGRSCVCGSCRVAHYCGRSCQRSHWKQHKPVCAALAAAAAVGVAAAEP